MGGWWSIVWGVVAAMVCAGCSAGGSLPFDPANPPAATNSFALPGEFMRTQGNRGWYFYQAAPDSTAYAILAWGAAPATAGHNLTECWRDGITPAALIAERKLHPAAGKDVIIAWRAPKAGQANVTLTMSSLDYDLTGDGVAVTFWHNTTRVSEPAILANQTGQSHNLTCIRTVAIGDTLYMRVNARTDAIRDWFSYAVDIRVL
jgi:hypothetical protein